MLILILSGPSGSGKSTLCKKVLDFDPEFKLSVSLTTRDKRPSETNGVDYFFVKKREFQSMIKKNELVEYVEAYGEFYGTHKNEIINAMNEEFNLVFDIDYSGMKMIKAYFRKHFPDIPIIAVYVMPPSLNELRQRLILRGDSYESIEKRLAKAEIELGYVDQYDYVIENFDLQKAFYNLNAILKENTPKKRFGFI